MSLIYHIHGVEVRDIKFRHLDYYDALAYYERTDHARENDPPWCYLRDGSSVTLCSAIIDGTSFEGWSHKVPIDPPRKRKGNLLALGRCLRAAGKDRAWRKDFWRTYFEAQKVIATQEQRAKIRLVKGSSIVGEAADVKAE